MSRSINLSKVIVLALALRLVLALTPLPALLAHRPELATVLTSSYAAKEAVSITTSPSSSSSWSSSLWATFFSSGTLDSASFSPLSVLYSGNSTAPVHFPPLLLLALKGLAATTSPSMPALLPHFALIALASLADVVAALALADAGSLMVGVALSPDLLAALYLLNPLSLLTALAGSLAPLSNAAVVVALAAALRRRVILATAALASAIYLAVAPYTLVLGLGMVLSKTTGISCGRGLALAAAGTAAWLAVFALASTALASGSWAWLKVAYGPIVGFSALRPNVGIGWYLHTEMFEHFRTFFQACFHGYAAIFALPLTLRFAASPVYLYTLLAGVAATFRPYPQMADMATYLAIAALHAALVPRMRYAFLTLNLMIFACAVLFTFWRVWVVLEVGNANFLNNANLVYCMANVWFLLDFVYAKAEAEATMATASPHKA
ncbi:uncharacterized protein AMSG_10452 [Thecamonas trahens ATCC 50062]|uniref:GPI transamidase subunit PIG-U n=1 Tax=Thecamonas trahens ATCC 50062 TaxID=461836 RepID=A0A0L0DR15_THETB|nr:hypothetical protein AMSG_10452 [Thecamonas trahens ATCC 50062]KNC54456.1 hypothetical protein AMSG_10452 [Thecamonas trahens ATCC 50062]|eukprot:XP_013753611.1 hypothetical protein AMSG_10452 [Thecamonas trahens ATCC 50062]